MKIFIGEAVTGQDLEVLKKEIDKIYSALEKAGHKPYSTMEEEGEGVVKGAGDWLDYAFKKLDENDVFLVLVKTEHRSEGLLMEIGYCLAKKKKIILAIKDDVKNTYLPEVVDKVIRWKDFDDLITKLSDLKIK